MHEGPGSFKGQRAAYTTNLPQMVKTRATYTAHMPGDTIQYKLNSWTTNYLHV